MLDILKEYELLIVGVETDILRLDEGLVQDGMGYVPLSILLAKFAPWQAPLEALASLVKTLSGAEWTPGRILDLLAKLSKQWQ